MPFRRLRSLMIVVAVIALDLAGILWGSPYVALGCLIFTMGVPIFYVIRSLVRVAREIGINAMFR